MNTREKVIVVLAVLAVLIGTGYHFLWDRSVSSRPGQDRDAAEIAEALAISSQIDAEVEKLGLSPHETGLLSLIAAPCVSDPFLIPVAEDPAALVEEDYQDLEQFAYTGYIEVGPIQAAIINGRERFVGDELDQPGYRVLIITPSRVVISRPDGETRLEIAYQGMEFFP